MAKRRKGYEDETLIEVWRAAQSEPLGILIKCSDITYAKMCLYSCRRKYADEPGLASLQIRTSPFPDGDLIICHNFRTPQPNPATNLAPIDLAGVLDLDGIDE